MKQKTVWYCTSCGNESSKWMGRCPACGEWNTMVEAPVEQKSASSRDSRSASYGAEERRKPVRLAEIENGAESRVSLGLGEVVLSFGSHILEVRLKLAVARQEELCAAVVEDGARDVAQLRVGVSEIIVNSSVGEISRSEDAFVASADRAPLLGGVGTGRRKRERLTRGGVRMLELRRWRFRQRH